MLAFSVLYLLSNNKRRVQRTQHQLPILRHKCILQAHGNTVWANSAITWQLIHCGLPPEEGREEAIFSHSTQNTHPTPWNMRRNHKHWNPTITLPIRPEHEHIRKTASEITHSSERYSTTSNSPIHMMSLTPFRMVPIVNGCCHWRFDSGTHGRDDRNRNGCVRRHRQRGASK